MRPLPLQAAKLCGGFIDKPRGFFEFRADNSLRLRRLECEESINPRVVSDDDHVLILDHAVRDGLRARTATRRLHSPNWLCKGNASRGRSAFVCVTELFGVGFQLVDAFGEIIVTTGRTLSRFGTLRRRGWFRRCRFTDNAIARVVFGQTRGNDDRDHKCPEDNNNSGNGARSAISA